METPAEAGALGITVERDVAVPMRDGVVLRANVFRPDADGGFPGLLMRTPYGKPAGGYERYVRAGYAVVTQDSRGRYASDGEWVPFCVQNTGDAEDGYDSVEWLAQQPFCNGRVGTLGASYNAWMQWELARLRPPHLVAMCAYTIPLELTAVDWPGAFRAGRRIKWWLTSMAPDLRKREGLPPPHTPAEASHLWSEVEQGQWVGFMPWKELWRYLPEGLARHVRDWLDHPNRRAWGFEDIHGEVEVPNLDFSGWYDHCNDTMRHLSKMQRGARTEAARTQTKLVAGPWNHPGLGKRQIGDIDFGPQAELDLTQLITRWFDYWLKGVANGVDEEPAVRYFSMGSNRWKSAPTWPPEGTQPRRLELRTSGAACQVDGGGRLEKMDLGADGPEADGSSDHGGADSYEYDPRNPVPTLWGKAWFTSPADRRVLESRGDILYYRSAPLEEDLEIAGYPEVVLYASSSAPDTDFFARLVDEHPTEEGAPEPGPALEVCYGMVRARHRHSLDEEELLEPGEVTEFRISLGPTACCFLRGHRVRLEITSSDFPNHDRNHNTGRDDLADPELVTARQTVYSGGEHPSRLVLPGTA